MKWLDIKYAPKDGTSILAKVQGYIPCVVEWVVYGGEGRWSIDPETFAEEDHFQEYWESIQYDPTHFIYLDTLEN